MLRGASPAPEPPFATNSATCDADAPLQDCNPQPGTWRDAPSDPIRRFSGLRSRFGLNLMYGGVLEWSGTAGPAEWHEGGYHWNPQGQNTAETYFAAEKAVSGLSRFATGTPIVTTLWGHAYHPSTPENLTGVAYRGYHGVRCVYGP